MFKKTRGRGGYILREGQRKGWVRVTRRPVGLTRPEEEADTSLRRPDGGGRSCLARRPEEGGRSCLTRSPEERVGECYEKARGRGGYGFREAQRKGVNHVLRENQRKGWW